MQKMSPLPIWLEWLKSSEFGESQIRVSPSSSPNPQYRPSAAVWRWNSWLTESGSIQSHPASLTIPCTPTTTTEFLKNLLPVPRLVQISEIVDALFYLQSAPMVNGENIRIDGRPSGSPNTRRSQ